MNDRRFIELLNLYVDQELSEDAARELERVIAENPHRRRVYGQYCRMQRACVKLLAHPKAPAPQIEAMAAAAAAPGDAAPDEILHRPVEADTEVAHRGATAWWGWGSGALAAAASIALLVVSLGTDKVTERPGLTATAGTTVAAVEDERSPLAPDSAPSATYHRVLVMNALPWSDAEGGVAPGIDPLDEPSLAWLEQLKLTPIRRLSFESLQFDSSGGVREAAEPGFVNGAGDHPTSTELQAFEFQR